MHLELTQNQFQLIVRTVKERIEDLKARESTRKVVEDEIIDLSNLLTTWMAKGLI